MLIGLHVGDKLRRGERNKAASLSWTSSASLPVPWFFATYVDPSAFFGLEFVQPGSQLQTRSNQWGRRLLMWPSGAPSAAVQRQLGWSNIWSARLVSAAVHGHVACACQPTVS